MVGKVIRETVRGQDVQRVGAGVKRKEVRGETAVNSET